MKRGPFMERAIGHIGYFVVAGVVVEAALYIAVLAIVGHFVAKFW